MSVTAQKVFKDLESGSHKPLYLIVGTEPFQANEILSQFKRKFLKEETSQALNFETWDGEGLNAGELLNSLDMLPGLFAAEEEIRLIVCQRFEKVSAANLELLQNYLVRPSTSTVFLMFADKVDKRKSWYKTVEQSGDIIEIREPYDREWPKWSGFFERKYGKKIEPAAWEMLVSASGRCLSLLATEIDKMAVYLNDKPTLQLLDVRAMGAYSAGEDVFSLVEDVAMKRKSAALRKYDVLMRNGESDIKLLSIIVRQFKMIEQAMRLAQKGVTDSKMVASQIGAHPFFVPKILEQMKKHNEESLGKILDLLATCDYQIKTGDGSLFERFLVPYFSMK
jgi:DNA polymerase-3 subunit delta